MRRVRRLAWVALCVWASGCTSCEPLPPPPCPDTHLVCDDRCVSPRFDRRHCGGCGQACGEAEVCADGRCAACEASQTICFGRCAALADDESNCGACGARCEGGACVAGACVCTAPRTACPGGCFELDTSRQHCGACGVRCLSSEVCDGGACELACPSGLSACSGVCRNVQADRQHCGACDQPCGSNELCDAGRCGPAPDPDGDGYTVLSGDCCETVAQCPVPAAVNPGARELPGNGLDDDCDGVVDGDRPDGGCDGNLPTGSAADAGDYARAMDICEGLVWARVKRVDGSPAPLDDPGIGVHRAVGQLGPVRSQRLLVIGSGAANVSGLSPFARRTPVDLSACSGPGCLADWFRAGNGTLKAPGRLPSAPRCQAGSSEARAYDGLMLHLRLKAPAWARAFSFVGRFYSQEYPEFVCSPFNDQLVVLTSSLSPMTPADRNLMTVTYRGQAWPIGINVAAGTPLFQACETQAVNPRCWDSSVSPESCREGPGALAGTYFDRVVPTQCLPGGATSRLLTRGNVLPGEEFELRIAIWDVGDPYLDSFVVLDDFTWGASSLPPGTVGTRVDGGVID